MSGNDLDDGARKLAWWFGGAVAEVARRFTDGEVKVSAHQLGLILGGIKPEALKVAALAGVLPSDPVFDLTDVLCALGEGIELEGKRVSLADVQAFPFDEFLRRSKLIAARRRMSLVK